MSVATVHQALEGLSSDAKIIAIAIPVLLQRVSSLAKEDQNDLFEIFMSLRTANGDDEIRSVVNAAVEILTQGEIVATPMPMPHPAEDTLPDKLQKWSIHVGAKIKELREKAGLTQEELSEKCRIPQSHLSRLENAKHSATRYTLEKIAKALGVEVGVIDPCED